MKTKLIQHRAQRAPRISQGDCLDREFLCLADVQTMFLPDSRPEPDLET